MQFILNNRRHRYGIPQWLVLAAMFVGGGAARCPAADQPPSNGTPPPTNAGQMTAELSQYMSQVRQGKSNDGELYPLSMRYGTALLPQLKVYARDRNPEIVSQATTSIFSLLKDTQTPVDRREIVTCLTDMLEEGYETGRRWDVVRPMLAFSKADDLSPDAKRVLHNLLSRVTDGTYENPYQIQEIILLIGIADIQSELPRLQEIIDHRDEALRQMHQREIDKWHEQVAAWGENIPLGLQLSGERLRKKTYWQSSTLWDALRARARMGVKEDIRRCIEMAESHPDSDYRSNCLFNQLAYIRQPDVVEYLAGYLDSDKRPRSGGLDTITTSYAASAAKSIVKMLEDTPIKPPYKKPTPKDIVALQRWMAEQSEWEIVR